MSRRYVSTMLGIFTYAGVVILPLPMTALLVVTVYAAAWPTFRRAGMPAHRWAYNTGAGALSCVCASWVAKATPVVIAIPAGIATFMAVNLALVAAAIVAAGHRQALAMLRNPRTHAVVVVTQVLGAAVGHMMTWQRPAALLVLPALYAFHLWAARGTVEDEKAFDASTGLWTEQAWTAQASDLVAAGPAALVVVVDAPFSDRRMVADVVRGCLRERDLFGSYDDGKIVVAANFGAAVTGRLIAQRVRKSLGESFNYVHMGSCSTSGEDLPAMLMAALTDLMAERDRFRAANPR